MSVSRGHIMVRYGPMFGKRSELRNLKATLVQENIPLSEYTTIRLSLKTNGFCHVTTKDERLPATIWLGEDT